MLKPVNQIQPDLPEPTRPYRSRNPADCTLQETPASNFRPTFRVHFPQEFLSPHVSEKSNQAKNVPRILNTRDCVPPLQLRVALSPQITVQLIFPKNSLALCFRIVHQNVP